MRTASQMMEMYVQAHRDDFLNPFRAEWPDDPRMTWTMARSLSEPDLHRWDFATYPIVSRHTEPFAGVWYSFIAEFRGGRREDEEGVSPADGMLVTEHRRLRQSGGAALEGGTLFPTSFMYSKTFWIAPRWFGINPCEVLGPEDLRTANLANVRYPSAKVVLWERADWTGRGEPPIWTQYEAGIHTLLVDGSMLKVDIADLYEAYARSESRDDRDGDLWPSPKVQDPTAAEIFMSTFRGIHGRDLPR